MPLSKAEILGIKDIKVKKIPVPAWDGEEVCIRQLSRAQQDTYLKRQYSATRLQQDSRSKTQKIEGVSIYGHDAYLCACGLCDENGVPLFSEAEAGLLESKNGEAIGYIALQIVEYSGMRADVEVSDELKN